MKIWIFSEHDLIFNRFIVSLFIGLVSFFSKWFVVINSLINKSLV